MKDFPAGHATAAFYFTTHASDGSPVAPLSAFEAADVKLYKNGSATERTSTSGWTMTSPFDSIVGLHRLLIDLSDNTDAGFYAAGSTYTLVLTPDETVDGMAVVKVVGEFSIGFALLASDLAAIGAKTTNLPSDPADQSLIIAATNTILADTNAILADTAELQTDWANGGRLDLILDTRASQVSVDDLPTNAELTTALAGADDAMLAALAVTDGKVDAVKAKTDGLTFTVAGAVDANIQRVNDVVVTGTGASGDEWGP